jgi:hypothetical protein
MPDQHGFGYDGPESTRLCQSGQGDDQMNEHDSEVAHSGNGINTSKTAALRLVWQFAMGQAPDLFSQEPKPYALVTSLRFGASRYSLSDQEMFPDDS